MDYEMSEKPHEEPYYLQEFRAFLVEEFNIKNRQDQELLILKCADLILEIAKQHPLTFPSYNILN